MSKWVGKIGYAVTSESTDKPGIWTEDIIEKTYIGDVIKNNRRLQSTDTLNDNINISNEISIIADPFAQTNFHNIRYVTFMGSKWKVSNVDVQYPRLILSVGGVYNEH